MKQTTICHEYGLRTEPKRGQIRHSVLSRTAFSRFCWRCYSERIFCNILGKLFARCSLPCEQATRENGKNILRAKRADERETGRSGRDAGAESGEPVRISCFLILLLKLNQIIIKMVICVSCIAWKAEVCFCSYSSQDHFYVAFRMVSRNKISNE